MFVKNKNVMNMEKVMEMRREIARLMSKDVYDEIVLRVKDSPGIGTAELSEDMGRDKTFVSKILGEMKKVGLVRNVSRGCWEITGTCKGIESTMIELVNRVLRVQKIVSNGD